MSEESQSNLKARVVFDLDYSKVSDDGKQECNINIKFSLPDHPGITLTDKIKQSILEEVAYLSLKTVAYLEPEKETS